MTNQTNKDYISLHHIGSRGGSRSFPINTKFEHEMINVLYDADPDCLQQAKKVNQQLKSKLIIYPYCLSNKKEFVEFYITYDPNLSSFYKPKKMSLDYYYFSHAGYDYNFNESSKIEKVINVETTTLDILLDEKKTDFIMPDFLSLDTQGSELKILDGSSICLENTLAVVLETEFIEFYENQPCFDDVLKYMKKKGFDFIRFTNTVEQNAYNYPVEIRSRGRITDADALFIRSPEYLEKTLRNNLSSYYKLSFIYISFDMLESALECVKKIDEKWKLSNHLEYYKFLNEVYECSKKFTIYPKKFSDKYTVEESHLRYAIHSHRKSSLRVFLCQLGPLTKIMRLIRDKAILFGISFRNLIINFKLIENLKKTEMEILLEKNNFHSLSEIVYTNRIKIYKSNGIL